MDLQKENLLNEELQEIEIFDKPGLFSNGRLRDEEVPKGLYRYDLRGSDYDPGQPITVEKTVVVNHAASVLMAEELDLGAEGRLELGEEGLNFTGAELTVRELMEEQQQKRNGLIHGDSDRITVEGHAYDKIPSERMNADKCIGFCIEEDGGFVGIYELVVNDKVQRENINSINYFRDDKLVQQAISDMEKLMAARQQSKEQERGSTKKSVLDALRSLKAKKQEQPAQEQPKPQKGKKRGDIEL